MAVAQLLERLRELAQLTAQTPLYNPVFQLSHELSRELERGDIALEDIEAGSMSFTTKVSTRGPRASPGC